MKFNAVAGWLSGVWISIVEIGTSDAKDFCQDDVLIGGKATIICYMSKTIPTDLEENIKRLVLTRISDAASIVADDPLIYTKLTYLSLTKLTIKVPANFFSLLQNLEMLAISQVNFNDFDALEMPPSITSLLINGLHLDKPLDLSNLHHLEDLSYIDSELTEFPSIPSTAPIKLLNMPNNSLTNLMLLDIAQYCLLNFTNFANTGIQKCSDEAYCELGAWFESHNISYILKKSTVFCSTNDTKECPKTVPKNANAEQKYDNCLNKGSVQSIVFVLIAVLTLILLAAGLGYFIWRQRAGAEDSSADSLGDATGDSSKDPDPDAGPGEEVKEE